MRSIKDVIENGKPVFGDLTGQVYKFSMNLAREQLDSLKGSPKEVLKDFDCSKNNLTTLEFAPSVVGGDFDCSGNRQLKSLEFCPKKIGDTFYWQDSDITDDERLEEVIKYGVKAKLYSFSNLLLSYDEIKDRIDDRARKNVVKRKGFRTLLGLEK